MALCRAGRHVVLIGDGLDGVGEQLHPAARPLLARLGQDTAAILQAVERLKPFRAVIEATVTYRWLLDG